MPNYQCAQVVHISSTTSSNGETKQWINWEKQLNRKRDEESSRWYEYPDKYQPIFKFFDPNGWYDGYDGNFHFDNFWGSVGECQQNRQNITVPECNFCYPTTTNSKTPHLRLTQGYQGENGYIDSCLNISLNEAGWDDIMSKRISSSEDKIEMN